MSDDQNPDKPKLDLSIEEENTQSPRSPAPLDRDETHTLGGSSPLDVAPPDRPLSGSGDMDVSDDSLQVDVEVMDSEIVDSIEDEDFQDLDDLQDLAADEFESEDVDIGEDSDEDYDFYDDEAVMATKKSSSGFPVKAAAIAAVLIAAVGGGGYFYLNSAGSDKVVAAAPVATPVAQYDSVDAGSMPDAPMPLNNMVDDVGAMPDDGFGLPQPTVAENDIPRGPSGDVFEIDAQPPAYPGSENMASATVSPDDFEIPSFGDDSQMDQGSMDDKIPAYGSASSDIEEMPETAQIEEDTQDDFFATETQKNGIESMAPPMIEHEEYGSDDTMNDLVNRNTTSVTPNVLPSPVQKSGSTYKVGENAAQKKVKPTQYYDSGVNVPKSTLETAVGPRQVDPVVEPGSKFVVVNGVTRVDSQEALLQTANRALSLERYEAALDLYNKLYEKNKRDPRILMGRAVSLHKVGRMNAAIQAYEELMDLDENNISAMVNLLGLLKEQYPSVASRRLQELQAKHPENASLAAQLGVAEGDLGNYEAAIRYLGIAASIEPNKAQHYYNMGIISERAGKVSGAIDAYQKALDVDAVYGINAIPRELIYDRIAILRRR